MGGERGGTLPRLGTAEEDWERKEGGGTSGGRGGAGCGRAGYGGAGAAGASAGGMGGGYGYEGQEVRLDLREQFGDRQRQMLTYAPLSLHSTSHSQDVAGVPAGSGREKYPCSWSDFWHDWKLGLTYNNSEWG